MSRGNRCVGTTKRKRAEAPTWDLVARLYDLYDAVRKYRMSVDPVNLDHGPDCASGQKGVNNVCDCGLMDMRQALDDIGDYEAKHGRPVP